MRDRRDPDGLCGEPYNSYDSNSATQVQAAVRTLAGYLDAVHCCWADNAFGEPESADDVVGDWNDDADRTADEVIDILRDAADDWDSRHPGGAR